jgi:hypothetical protein
MDHTVPYGGGSPAGDGTAQAAELDSALQQAHAAFGERLARALRTEPRPGQPLS